MYIPPVRVDAGRKRDDAMENGKWKMFFSFCHIPFFSVIPRSEATWESPEVLGIATGLMALAMTAVMIMA